MSLRRGSSSLLLFTLSTLTEMPCGNSSVGRARPCQGRGREFESRLPLDNVQAQVAELVDAHVSGACAVRRAGSSPVLGTLFFNMFLHVGEVAELVDALL